MSSYAIRRIAPAEIPILEDFLYEAIFLPPGFEPPPREILRTPELQVYIANFGKEEDDHCFVAEFGGRIVGAVWARIMDDYGHIDDETPSLAVSLYGEYRGRGIGTALMERMLAHLKEQGYGQVSLSVQKVNPAARLYRRLGFETVSENREEYVMICRL